jgi:hypothetical protein
MTEPSTLSRPKSCPVCGGTEFEMVYLLVKRGKIPTYSAVGPACQTGDWESDHVTQERERLGLGEDNDVHLQA